MTRSNSDLANNPPEIYSIAEVAAKFGVAKATVRRWIYDGKMKSIRPGGVHSHHRITADEVRRVASKQYGE